MQYSENKEVYLDFRNNGHVQCKIIGVHRTIWYHLLAMSMLQLCYHYININIKTDTMCTRVGQFNNDFHRSVMGTGKRRIVYYSIWVWIVLFKYMYMYFKDWKVNRSQTSKEGPQVNALVSYQYLNPIKISWNNLSDVMKISYDMFMYLFHFTLQDLGQLDCSYTFPK